MATSNTKLNGTRGAYYSITLSYVLNSQSIENNTSNVTITGTLKSDDSEYSYYGFTNTGKLSIDGTQVTSGSSTASVNTSGVQLFTYTGNISHNSDGTKTVTLKYDFSTTYSYLSATSLSVNWTLTTIPRASTLTLTATSLTITNATATLGFTATSKGNFYHKLSWKVGSSSTSVVSGWNPKQINTTSASGTINTGAILDKMPTSTSGTLTFTLETFTDSAMTNLTGTSTATCSITINTTNIKPSVSLGTIGINTPSTFTYMVAGYSTAKATCTSTNSRGASSFTTRFTISKGSLAVTSTTSTSATVTTNTLPSGTSNYTFTITATITDSRGVSASVTKTSGTVYGYATPKITASFYRVASSGSSTADPVGTYVYRSFSATQNYTVNNWNNALVVSATQDGTAVTSGTTGTLADTSSATLIVTATDKVTTVTKTLTVGTATFPIDLYDDANGSVGVGFGTTAVGGLVTSALPIRLNSLQPLQSIDSSNTAFAIARYNGSNLWFGASAGTSHHHTGRTYISTGYDSTNAEGFDTIMASIPNASNTGSTNYGMWHSGNAPIEAYLNEEDWSTGTHDADNSPIGVVWCRGANVTNLPISTGFGWLMTVGNTYQTFALHSSSGVTAIYYRGYHSNTWDQWNLLANTETEAVDYVSLTNKPQINSVTLTGNKASSDLGLQDEIERVGEADIDNIIFGS